MPHGAIGVDRSPLSVYHTHAVHRHGIRAQSVAPVIPRIGGDRAAMKIWLPITATPDLLDLCRDGSAKRKARSENPNGQQ